MTERALANRGSRTRELFAEGPVVVFTWRNEPGWPVEYVSPNVERLFGYSPEELCAGDPPYAELIHDDDLDRVIREVKTNSDGTTKRFHHEPYRMKTKDGDVRWVLDYTRIILEDGAVIGYTGYVVDITERREQIAYVNALNATIRSLQEALIDADSREEIHVDVCEALAELEGFAGVWTGSVDRSVEEVLPVARARISESSLGSVPLSLEDDSPVPAVRVVGDRSFEGEHRVLDPDSEERWCVSTIGCGYRSVFSVPVRHRELVYGALTVYGTEAGTFDSRIREILLEFGALIGYAVTAVERRNALHGDGSRDIVLEVSVDEDDPLCLLSGRVAGSIEVRSVSRRKHNAPLLYCLIPGVDPRTAIEAANGVCGIELVEPLSEEETTIYEIVPLGGCAASKMGALGANLRSMRISEDSCELVVSVRRGRDQRRFVGQADELFGGAELKADRDAAPPDSMPWATLLTETLTDRQRDVLKTAYYAGYFDENRKRTGAEIADSLGIAQPTFSAHMRTAQRNILSAIWDPPDDG